MAATQENYSTNAVHYTFRRRTITRRTSPTHCTLAEVSMAGGKAYRIPCFFCSGLPRSGDYCDVFHRCIAALVGTHPHSIPARSAKHVADVFMSTVLLPAHDTLNCPGHPDPSFASVFHRVEIDILLEDSALQRDDTCAVCLEEIGKSASALHTPCEHVFHESCLVKWLENASVCPLCRNEIAIYED